MTHPPLANTQHYLIYNGINLNLQKIERFESEVEYSQDGVDRLWNHITISVRGLLNYDINNDDNNAVTLTNLRSYLLEPRASLILFINGFECINIPYGLDVNNGPKPTSVKVTQIMGATVLVEFTVEVFEGCDSGGPEKGVITNRWSQRTDIDQEGYSSITTDGFLIVRSDALGALGPRGVDSLRNTPTPISHVPQGFVRVAQTFQVSSDGLRLDYTIVDKENYRLSVTMNTAEDDYTGDELKRQITQWKGTWQEESDMTSGAFVVGTLTVQCTGTRFTTSEYLILFCIQVLNSRLREGDIVRYYRIEEGLDTNTMALTASVITFSQQDAKDNIKFTTRIGDPVHPLDDGLYTTVITPYGAGQFFGMYTNFVVPTCHSKINYIELPQNDPASPPSKYGSESTPPGKPYIPPDSNQITQDRNVYIKTQIETQIQEDSQIIQLAVATSQANSPCFYARPAQPLTKKVVRFSMERLNQIPVAPKPDITGHILLKKTVILSQPEILPSGVDRIYAITGEYIFGMTQTAQIGYNTLQMPVSPVDSVGMNEQSQVASTDFTSGLIA